MSLPGKCIFGIGYFISLMTGLPVCSNFIYPLFIMEDEGSDKGQPVRVEIPSMPGGHGISRYWIIEDMAKFFYELKVKDCLGKLKGKRPRTTDFTTMYTSL